MSGETLCPRVRWIIVKKKEKKKNDGTAESGSGQKTMKNPKKSAVRSPVKKKEKKGKKGATATPCHLEMTYWR